ncbi:MAG: class I SAM-dependent methyltransferase [Calditrichaeota bacterium]|nr:class I SAM-dependent methyltransferase [Calditrichota bacterium]MBT7617464.1 class I SAM-dependent methyltransferase [Calditrichota bacterium]
MDKYSETNRSLWNGWTKIHAESELYDLDSFKNGRCSLRSTELEEVGDVDGKSMLHLQCHFGQDTLSWARRGAEVTGVDFSKDAIDLAKSLSSELEIPAEFVNCDVYKLTENIKGQYDIIFTSYGVLPWLRDLNRWGEIVYHFLKPGGIFYIVEFHPFASMLDESGENFEFPYFPTGDAIKWAVEGSYANPDAEFKHDSYEWAFGLGDVITALTNAGLRIEFLHEFPYSNWNCRPYTKEIAPGRYVYPGLKHELPYMFSIRASKEQA